MPCKSPLYSMAVNEAQNVPLINCRLEYPTPFASWSCVKFPSCPLVFKQFRGHLFSSRVGLHIPSLRTRSRLGTLIRERGLDISHPGRLSPRTAYLLVELF